MEKTLNIALLIDTDNISNSDDIKTIIEEITAHFGRIFIKRAYGDWTNDKFNPLKQFFLENAIQTVQQPQYKDGKNATDTALIIDAMDILYTKENIDAFCIATGDSDFTRLVNRLRDDGKIVIGFGYTENSQQYLKSACDSYVYIDVINNVSTDNEISKLITPISDIQDYIVTYLNNRDSFSQLGGLKSSIKIQFPDFDERNYGYSKFSDFLQKEFTKEFEIKNNNISINTANQNEKVKTYVVNYLKSNNGSKSSVEIQNAIAKKFKSFRVKDNYSGMKSFLKSINGIEIDNEEKYYYKGR